MWSWSPRYVLGIAAPQIALPGRSALVRSFLLAPWLPRYWLWFQEDRMGRSYQWFMFVSYWFMKMVPNNIPYEYVLAIASGSQRFFYWSLLYPIVGHFWYSDSVKSPFCCWFHAGHSLMLVISYHRVEWDKESRFRSVGGWTHWTHPKNSLDPSK